MNIVLYLKSMLLLFFFNLCLILLIRRDSSEMMSHVTEHICFFIMIKTIHFPYYECMCIY